MKGNQSELDFEAQPIQACAPEPEGSDLPPPEFYRLADYLAEHCQGTDNARTAARIACDLELGPADGRKVRHLISLYQDRFPFVLCGQGGHGFWASTDPVDMTHYERSLHATIRSIGMKIHRFRRNANKNGYRRSHHGPRVTYSSALMPTQKAVDE